MSESYVLPALSVAQHVLLALIVTVGVIVTVLAGVYTGALAGTDLMIVLIAYIAGNSAHAISVAISASGVTVTTEPTPKP